MAAAFMKSAQALLVIALLLCARAVAQTAPSANQRSSAQVHGTMTDPTGAAFANINVTFQGDAQKQTVTTNGAGEYRAELPPGLYTLDVPAAGFRRYHRPFFSVTSQSNLTFDVTMQLTSSCDFVLVNNSGEPVTAEQQKAATEEMCIREELLPVQSKKGPAFSLFVQYGKRTLQGCVHNYGEAQPVMDPVFVAYNLFSLEADNVSYDERTQILDTHGHVVVVDQSSGEYKVRTGDWMKFKIENGQATLQGCVCNQFPKEYTRGRLFHQAP